MIRGRDPEMQNLGWAMIVDYMDSYRKFQLIKREQWPGRPNNRVIGRLTVPENRIKEKLYKIAKEHEARRRKQPAAAGDAPLQ